MEACLHKKQLWVVLDMVRVTTFLFDLGFQLGTSPRIMLNILV